MCNGRILMGRRCDIWRTSKQCDTLLPFCTYNHESGKQILLSVDLTSVVYVFFRSSFRVSSIDNHLFGYGSFEPVCRVTCTGLRTPFKCTVLQDTFSCVVCTVTVCVASRSRTVIGKFITIYTLQLTGQYTQKPKHTHAVSVRSLTFLVPKAKDSRAHGF